MYPRSCGLFKRRATRTRFPTIGAVSRARTRRAEDLLELVRGRDLELIVPAVERSLVGAPAQKDRSVAKPRSLHVVVLDLTHALDAQWLPREILPRAPAALSS